MPVFGSNQTLNAAPEFDWADIALIWRRRSAMIIAAGLIGAVGAYAFSYTVEPVYGTSAVLLIDRPDASKMADSTNTFQIDAAQRANLVRSQVEVLRSREIVDTVIDTLDLKDSTAFQEKSGLFQKVLAPIKGMLGRILQRPESVESDTARQTKLIQRYLDSLSVQQDVDTYIIRVDFTASDPELAARILNTHVKVYLNWLQTQRRSAVLEANNWLRHQAIPNAERRVLAAQTAVEEFRNQHKLVDINGKTSMDQGLAQVSTDLATAQTARIRARARADQIRALQASGQIDGIIALSDSRLLTTLQASAAASAAELAQLTTTHGPGYPGVAAARAHLAQIQAAINAEIDHLVQGETSTAEIAGTTVTRLTGALSESKQDKLTTENESAELNRLESVAQAEQKVYIDLLTRLRSFDDVGDLEPSQATLLSPALVPELPNSPRRMLFAWFGLFACSGLAGTVTVWQAGRRRVVRHTADLLLSSGVPQIAVMPELPLARRGGFDRFHPKYLFFQQELRRLYALLLRNGNHAREGIAVVVTSALPSEGKTSFSTEFARFAAESGIRTLLVTTDPTGRLAAPGNPVRDYAGTLFYASMPIMKNLADQGESAVTIRGWKLAYDLIIIDTPPVSFAVDSLVLAALADDVLVLARYERTPYPLLGAVVQQLENVGGRVAGAVLTFAKLEQQRGVLPNDPSYYFSSNREYYRKLSTIKLLEDAEPKS